MSIQDYLFLVVVCVIALLGMLFILAAVLSLHVQISNQISEQDKELLQEVTRDNKLR